MTTIFAVLMMGLVLIAALVAPWATRAHVARPAGHDTLHSAFPREVDTISAHGLVRIPGRRGVALLATLALSCATGGNTPVAADELVATIPVGGSPMGVAFSPDGTFAYVANNGSNTVSRIDLSTNTVTATIPVGGAPFDTAISPDGTFAYVTNGNDGTVSRIDTATDTVATVIPLVPLAHAVAISPDGTFAYVTANAADVYRIDTATDTVTATIPVGPYPGDIAVSPDSTFALVSNFGPPTAELIDTATNTVSATVASSTSGVGVAISPDGEHGFVAGFNGLTRIEMATRATTPLPMGTVNPYFVAFAPDGSYLYLTSRMTNNVYRMDPAGTSITATVSMASYGSGLAIGPSGTLALVSNASGDQVTRISTVSQPLDSDADGTPDAQDQCPGQVGLASNAGCPAPPPAPPAPPAPPQPPAPPAAPPVEKPAARVNVAATARSSKLFVDVDPDISRGHWTFRVERLRKNGTWARGKSYRTKGAHHTRTVNPRKGTYRVVVPPRFGFEGTTSSAVTLRR